MKTIFSFVMIALMMFVCVNVYAVENVSNPVVEAISEGGEISGLGNLSANPNLLPEIVKEDIRFYEQKLRAANLEFDKSLQAYLLDNVLSANEMKQLEQKLDALTALKNNINNSLGFNFWKIDSSVFQNVNFKEVLFKPYSEPLLRKRDKSGDIGKAFSAETGKTIIVESYFNWPLFSGLVGGLFIDAVLIFVSTKIDNEIIGGILFAIGLVMGIFAELFLFIGLVGG